MSVGSTILYHQNIYIIKFYSWIMNKKGSGILVFVILLALVVGGVVLYNSGQSSSSGGSSVTGSAVYNPSSSSSTNPSSSYGSNQNNCGGYGEDCCSGNYCDYGECQRGKCIHCGYMGETCCYNSVDGSQCEYGSECILGRCRVTDDYNLYGECGHIGYPPCQDYYGPYCSYGVYNSQAGICEHCGFLEQPCCLNTDYECDYGKCVNGICKLTKSTQTTTTNTGSGSNYNYYDSPDDYSSDSNSEYEDSNCGGLNQDCCEVGIQTSMWGGIEPAGSGCDDDLECRAGVCVEGPVYESAPRGGYYWFLQS